MAERSKKLSEMSRAIADRLDELALSQTDAARRAGLSSRTIMELRTGVDRVYTTKTIRLVEQALEWPRGTLRAYLSSDGAGDDQAGTETSLTQPRSSDELRAALLDMVSDLDLRDQLALLDLARADVEAQLGDAKRTRRRAAQRRGA